MAATGISWEFASFNTFNFVSLMVGVALPNLVRSCRKGKEGEIPGLGFEIGLLVAKLWSLESDSFFMFP